MLITNFILYFYAKIICIFYSCSPINGYEPNYESKKWNDKYIERSHNCYSYALDDINLNLANICEYDYCKGINSQPGHYCKSKYNLNTCFQLEKRILCDNPLIKKTTFEDKCPKFYYKIGLSIQENMLYHFYRQNIYGLWDHKDGGTKVSIYDADNNYITNPKLSNRNFGKYKNYNIWCNYYCVPYNGFIKTNMSRIKGNKLLY